MSPMVLLTHVYRGGVVAHILSAHVGWSLVNQQPPKHQHLSPPTSDSERNQDMTPAWNSRWALENASESKEQLWYSVVLHSRDGQQSKQQAVETMGQTSVKVCVWECTPRSIWSRKGAVINYNLPIVFRFSSAWVSLNFLGISTHVCAAPSWHRREEEHTDRLTEHRRN